MFVQIVSDFLASNLYSDYGSSNNAFNFNLLYFYQNTSMVFKKKTRAGEAV